MVTLGLTVEISAQTRINYLALVIFFISAIFTEGFTVLVKFYEQLCAKHSPI